MLSTKDPCASSAFETDTRVPQHEARGTCPEYVSGWPTSFSVFLLRSHKTRGGASHKLRNCVVSDTKAFSLFRGTRITVRLYLSFIMTPHDCQDSCMFTELLHTQESNHETHEASLKKNDQMKNNRTPHREILKYNFSGFLFPSWF